METTYTLAELEDMQLEIEVHIKGFHPDDPFVVEMVQRWNEIEVLKQKING